MADWPYHTTAWKRLRRAKLDADPMCKPCEAMGRMEAANTVDHRIPISAGGPPFPGLDGLESMCGPCHSAKTARGIEAGAARTSKARRGCDADGWPLDPAHPWNGKSLRAAETTPPSALPTQLVSSPGGRRHG